MILFLEFIFGLIFYVIEMIFETLIDFWSKKKYWFDDRCLLYNDGTQMWFQHGRLHRENDLPAIIYCDGTKEWWFNGLRHRDHDRAAIICSNGFMEWWNHGVLHRSGRSPAIINPRGESEWWQDGVKCSPTKYEIDWRKEGF